GPDIESMGFDSGAQKRMGSSASHRAESDHGRDAGLGHLQFLHCLARVSSGRAATPSTAITPVVNRRPGESGGYRDEVVTALKRRITVKPAKCPNSDKTLCRWIEMDFSVAFT